MLFVCSVSPAKACDFRRKLVIKHKKTDKIEEKKIHKIRREYDTRGMTLVNVNFCQRTAGNTVEQDLK